MPVYGSVHMSAGVHREPKVLDLHGAGGTDHYKPSNMSSLQEQYLLLINELSLQHLHLLLIEINLNNY